MSNASKRLRAIKEKIDRNRNYPVGEALQLIKESATAKFDESVDIAVNLGVDARKSDQMVRGSVVLPKGIGKTVRVAVFAQGDNVQKAKDAGADIVGFEDLAAEIKAGKMDFDVVIATPDAMRVVGALGQILGPRGLMPNPKAGTVTFDVTKAVREVKAGKIEYRVDKAGNVHAAIGKVSFPAEALESNFTAFMDQIVRSKPSASKGIYVRNVAISSTMGPGVNIDTTPYK